MASVPQREQLESLGPHHHVEAAVDWCSSILLALHIYAIFTIEISHFTIHKDRSQYVFGGRTEGP